jgi:DNA modification methylase
LPTLPDASAHCVVTSPPYWGLRDYGVAGQLGLEPTPEAYVEAMVGVFREVRRVLRDDGTCWLNMGDSYASTGTMDSDGNSRLHEWNGDGAAARNGSLRRRLDGNRPVGKGRAPSAPGLKSKDLVGMPWRLAFALQADGWYLRADIIWAKPNPMPESVTDRPTKAHEYVFLLSKAARYFYDADAVREPATGNTHSKGDGHNPKRAVSDRGECRAHNGFAALAPVTARNLRSVWTIPSAPFPEAHFATFPPALASRCIQAGTSERGCCAACGAPWERVVEPGRNIHPGSSHTHEADLTQGGTQTHASGRPAGTIMAQRWHARTPDRMLGWQPSCDCAAPVAPCTVLDPFAGSGTVGAVAERLGRHSVLVELSPAYVAMAERRTAQFGLFAQAPAE